MVTYGSGPWMFPIPDPSPYTNSSRGKGDWPHNPVIGIDY